MWWVMGGGWWGRWACLVKEDAALDGLAADGALAHSVPAQLARAVAAHEDHILQPVQTHGTHGLQVDGEKPRRVVSDRIFYTCSFILQRNIWRPRGGGFLPAPPSCSA